MTTIESPQRLAGGVRSSTTQAAGEPAAAKEARASGAALSAGAKPAPAPSATANGKGPESDIGKAVERLNHLVQQVRRELRFSIDESSGKTVITVLDAETDEVVRQIPAEQVMTVTERLADGDSALLMDVVA